MSYTNIFAAIFVVVVGLILIGATLNQQQVLIDYKLHKYDGDVISMELNHTKTTEFCRGNGYLSSYQWIIDESGYKVGYDIWGGDGHFNANDVRVHVECNGKLKTEYYYNYQELYVWLNKININPGNVKVGNGTYDTFCQQNNTRFKEMTGNGFVCYKISNTVKEYTPQEIARWYLSNRV